MKTYRFNVHNWHNDRPNFWFYKQFRNDSEAEAYAERITFKKGAKSIYMIVCFNAI